MRIRLFERCWKDAICLSFLGILIVIVFWPVLFEGRLLLPTDQFDTMTLPFSSEFGHPQAYNHNFTDALMQSYPWKVTAQHAFRNGEFYYWNPHILNGYPQYATSRQTYDVFNLLLIPIDLPFAFNLIIILELFTAGVGMYVLLRVHGRRRIIATMFASAWIFNGMFLTDLLNLWALATFCWIPFSLAMSFLYHRKGSPNYLLAAGFFLGLALLGSTIQSVGFATITIVIVNTGWSARGIASSEALWTMRLRLWMRKVFRSIGIPLGVALALSAIMWVPAVELFLEVTKHGTLYSPAHAHSYSLINRLLSFVLLLTFFVPETMGIVRSMSVTSLVGLYPMDFSGYLGFAEMLLGVWAMFSVRSSEKDVHPYAWLVAAGFLLPIFTPLFAWLYHRFFIVGTIGLTVLGAERLEAFLTNAELRERGRKWAKWAFRGGLAGFTLLIVLNLALTLVPTIHSTMESFLLTHAAGTPFADGNARWVHDRVADTFQHYSVLSSMMLVPFGIVFALCVLILRWNRWSSSYQRYFVMALFACSTFHSIFWWSSYVPMLDPLRFPLLPSHSSITYLKSHLGDERVFVVRRGYPGRQYLFLDNLPPMYGISEITGYESEVIRSFYPYLDTISGSSPHPRALGLMGVKYLMFLPGIVSSGTLPVADSGVVMIYSDTSVHNRATLYYHSKVLPNDTAVLSAIFDETSDHNDVLFSANSDLIPNISDSSGIVAVPDSAHIVKEEDNELDITANPSRPAYLVLSDTYYPGWRCYVDGNEQTIYRANFAMRAVLLRPGHHRIAFRFIPCSAVIGAGCSAATAIIVIVLLCAIYWRRRLV
jgi:hypothetical protein